MSAAADALEPTPSYILECAEAIARHDKRLRAMSPPCKLTPSVAVKLLTVLRTGSHYEPACALAGISYSAFYDWMNRGEDEGDEGPFGVLRKAVKVAEAEAEVETMADVRKASKDNRFWAAGMTFLERRHPDRWRRPDAAQQVNVQVGVALGVQVSDEQRRAIVPALSPTPERLIGSSPLPVITVSEAQPEAKATPIEGVSPASVT